MNNEKKFMIFSVIIYSLISGVGGLIASLVYNLTDINYITYTILGLIIQIMLVLWAFYSYMRLGTKKKLFDSRVDLNVLWILPHMVLITILFFDNIRLVAHFDTVRLVSLIVYFFTCILIGISEEVLFRGGILQYFSGISKRKAVIYSALIFSLFHLSNLLISFDIGGTIAQLISTFIFGLFASGIALKMKTLLPLIIYHALWDFIMQITVFSETVSPLSGALMGFNQVLNLIIGIILLISFVNHKKKGKKNNE